MNNYDLILNFKITNAEPLTEQKAKQITGDAEVLVKFLEKLNHIKVENIVIAEGIYKRRVSV